MIVLNRELFSYLQVRFCQMRLAAQISLIFLTLARYKESAALKINQVHKEGVRVWLPIRAQNIKQKCDILEANFCTFHLDPSIVQRFAPFSARICTCLLAFGVKVQEIVLFFMPFIVWQIFLYLALCQDQHN